jgi:predicted AlkP superfamily pyrophosphatase or phosphodiesterase
VRRLLQGARIALALLVAAGGAPAAPPSVVMVSLDGTRPADVRDLPVFRRIAGQGAAAEGLEPAFPSNTFPNHVTLATGVAPDRHGIVNNVFVDPERGLYRYEDDPTWLEVEPLWSLLARAGLPSASFHWVGSEGRWRNGLGPRHWEKFDAKVPEKDKVQQILAWLDLRDVALRPRLVTCWMRGGDATGHRFGPGTKESQSALRRQDRALAQLLDGLDARGLLSSTTLLVVSDHGMARVERSLDLEAELAKAGVRADVVGGGGFATARLRRGEGQRRAAERERALARALEVAHGLGLEAWARGNCPAPFACAHPRFGDFVAVAPVGTAIVDGSRALAAPAAALGLGLNGSHGHRPELPEMAGIFFAVGNGVTPGLRLETVRAVDVAPTVLALLGQPIPEWMAGRPIVLRAETEPRGEP